MERIEKCDFKSSSSRTKNGIKIYSQNAGESKDLLNPFRKPTKTEIDAEVKRLQDEYEANEYQRSRASEYPSIPDQLDEIYHNGVDSWKAIIKQTKNKYPKG